MLFVGYWSRFWRGKSLGPSRLFGTLFVVSSALGASKLEAKG